MSEWIHILYADLRYLVCNLDRAVANLSEDERVRAAGYKNPTIARRFAVSRFFLRSSLGAFLDVPPCDVRLTRGAQGKPLIDPGHGCKVTFNLSHSGELAALVVAYDRAVGIDVEEARSVPHAVQIARNWFSTSEWMEIDGLTEPQRSARFLGKWTRREAEAKMRGTGLAVDAALDLRDKRAVETVVLNPPPGWIGALVVEARTSTRIKEGVDFWHPPGSPAPRRSLFACGEAAGLQERR